MRIIPTNMRDRKVSTKRGVAIVTLLVALGITASASDPGSFAEHGSGRQRDAAGIRSDRRHGTEKYFQGKKTANRRVL